MFFLQKFLPVPELFHCHFFPSLIRCQGSRVAFHGGTYVRYSTCSFDHLQPLHLPLSPLAAVAAFSRSPHLTGAQRVASPWPCAHVAAISAVTARADRRVCAGRSRQLPSDSSKADRCAAGGWWPGSLGPSAKACPTSQALPAFPTFLGHSPWAGVVCVLKQRVINQRH